MSKRTSFYLRKLSFVFVLTFILVFGVDILSKTIYAALPELKEITEDEYYGRNALSKMEDSETLLYVYDQLVEGIAKADKTITVYDGEHPITLEDLFNVYKTFMNDYPQFFWIGDTFTYNSDDEGTTILSISPAYNELAEEIETNKETFDMAIKELIKGIDASMSEFERELVIHDRIVESVIYDTEAANAHNAYGALIEGEAVHDGYSRLFQYAMYKLGIQCYTVAGTAYDSEHAWNIIRIDRKYYYVDVTWDDASETMIYHTYFNIPLSEIKESHLAKSFIEMPECNYWDANYFTIFGGRIEENTVDIWVKMMKPKMQAKLYIVGDNSGVWDWFKENKYEIAEKIGITSGCSIGCTHYGKEWNVYFKNCTRDVIPVTSVIMSEESYRFSEIGETFTIKATVEPAEAQNYIVYYSSSNTDVAIVNKYTGLVTCVGEGKADIIATSDENGVTGVCEVRFGYDELSVTADADKTDNKVGDEVIISAMVAGGKEEYTYSYIVYNKATKKWFRLADNIEDSTFTWKATSEGDRRFYVDVKDSSGIIVRSNAVDVVTKSKYKFKVTGESNLSSVYSGENVTLSAIISEDEATYTYSYIVHNKTTNEWFRIANNISESSYVWKATSVGERVFYIDVKDSTGEIVRSNAINVNVMSKNNLKIVVETTACDISEGDKVMISAKASGGEGTLTYSFIVYNELTGKKFRFSGFTSKDTLSWTASGKGNRVFYVEVKDSGTGEVIKSEGINIAVS